MIHFTTLLICKQQVLFHSIPFSCSLSRCSYSRNSHSKKVEIFVKLEKTAFLLLIERRRKSSSVIVEIVVCCLIATNFNHSANPIEREFHPVWQMRKITLLFLFFIEFRQLLRTSRFQTSFHFSSFQQSSKEKKKSENITSITKTVFINECKNDSYEKCGDNHAMFIRLRLKTNLRTAISGGKRPNPSDLGS